MKRMSPTSTAKVLPTQEEEIVRTVGIGEIVVAGEDVLVAVVVVAGVAVAEVGAGVTVVATEATVGAGTNVISADLRGGARIR